MPKIVFLGAGSYVFARNILGDCMLTPALADSHIALVDTHGARLRDSELMLKALNKSLGANCTIEAFTDRREALKDADYLINAIQVGELEERREIDFEIPKKYGLRQTIGDTLGIGGIFRGLRTIPVMLDITKDMEELCPDAWILNYVNPMAAITGAIQRATQIRTVGLCHSVQVCAEKLCEKLDMPTDNLKWRVAGINHQGWLLEVLRNGEDLYPEIKRRAVLPEYNEKDTVRFEIMKRFGYYLTESSEHTAEYTPYFIKDAHPELLDEFHIMLDDLPQRDLNQRTKWAEVQKKVESGEPLTHERSTEYASHIIEAMEINKPYTFGGSVLNHGIITNLPQECAVEVQCLVDGNGVQPCYVGELPPQCAAINRTNINVHELAIQAALTGKREHIYHAAMLDPHTSSELTIDEIYKLVDEMIEAHGDMLPEYK
ncbi:alpha-glucosidase/alpha-galactosidase [Candidatus Hydrogenedentota bacterium]